MDPLVIGLLAVFIGIPLLSFAVMLLFALSADYEPSGVELRGGSLRGAIASALAKIVVGDTKTFQLPLVVKLEKIGILGRSTPLIGGATVRDIEWRIYADGEHVSTVTEASSVRVGSRDRHLELPVNAEIHLPRGLIGTYRKYRQDRKRGHEMHIEVRGHVIVKHWWMTREMPVRVTRHVVVGDPEPTLEVRFEPDGPEPVERARLSFLLTNPYQEEVLEGSLRVELQEDRRMRRDPVRAAIERPFRIAAGQTSTLRLAVEGVHGAAPEQVIPLRPRVLWAGRVLHAEPVGAVSTVDEPGPPTVTVHLRTGGDPPLVQLLKMEEAPSEAAAGQAGPFR